MKLLTTITIFILSAFVHSVKAQVNIYHDGWIDFNKNGKKDVFEGVKPKKRVQIVTSVEQFNLFIK